MSCEVEQAIKQMVPSKSLRPDDMLPIFYQKLWHAVGPDVIKGVLSCLNLGQLLRSINHTNIIDSKPSSLTLCPNPRMPLSQVVSSLIMSL